MENLNDLIRNATEGRETSFEVHDILDGNDHGGKRLEVSRRELQKERSEPPRRTESHARNHELQTVASLIAYLQRYGGESTVVFVQVGGSIEGVVDECAEKGREAIRCHPKPHPMWWPWASCLGRTIDLASFLTLLRKTRRAIHLPEARGLIAMCGQVSASRKIQAHYGSGATSMNGMVIETRIRGGKTDDTAVELPESIVLNTPLFMEEDALEFSIDLTFDVKEADPERPTSRPSVSVEIHSADAELAIMDAYHAMADNLIAALPEATIVMGSRSEEVWEYLDK